MNLDQTALKSVLLSKYFGIYYIPIYHLPTLVGLPKTAFKSNALPMTLEVLELEYSTSFLINKETNK